MITYVVLYPGEIATGATFVSDAPTLELAADALALYHGHADRDDFIRCLPQPLVVGFAPLH
jgi:hypothetical protein